MLFANSFPLVFFFNHVVAIYKDIYSYIKGSNKALESKKGCLTLLEYLNMKKKASISSSANREKTYDAFDRYEKKMVQRNDFDILQMVHHLYHELKKGCNFQKFDNLYVDECQDFTQSFLTLLSTLVKDVNKCTFAGDRTQSINRGVNFDFNALGAKLYHTSKKGNVQATGTKAQITQLTQNYRCTNGILGVSNLTQQTLLQGFFPRLVDSAEPEQSHFGGSKPEIVEDVQWQEVIPIIQADNPESDFGAATGILVRNSQARDALLEAVPAMREALVLTILEAKGLEFNTVVIVNFWKDSLAEAWLQRLLMQLIRNAAKEPENNAPVDMYQTLREALKKGKKDNSQSNRAQRRLNRNTSTGTAPLDLSNFEEDYCMFADELKQLYVAVTRSRHRVIMFDEDREKRAPFYLLCQLTGVTRPSSEMMDGDGSSRRYTSSSSSSSSSSSAPASSAKELKRKAAEWGKQGKALFVAGFYERAALCFKNAGNVNECRNATARHLIDVAAAATTSNEKSSALFAAGFEFLMTTQRDNLQAAQQCFVKAGYSEIAQNPYFGSVAVKKEGGSGGGKKVAKKRNRKKKGVAVNYPADY